MTLKIRPAELSDSRAIFDWRNDAHTRAMSLSSAEVVWSDHVQWLEGALMDEKRILLIGEDGGEKIGVVRFDLDKDQAEVSINLNPDCRGRRYATSFLVASQEALPKSVCRILAKIKDRNAASQRVFEKAGYIFLNEREGVRKYQKQR